jgi:thioesterase domain-containing protein
LGDRQPVYAIEGPQTGGHKATDRTVEAMASRYVGDLRRAVPEGPCVIFGHSFGGLLALEMAHQLQVLGQEVILLAIGDTPVGQFSGWSPLPLGPRMVQMAKKVPGYGPRAAGRRALDVSRGFAGRKKAERARKEAAHYLSTGETAPLSIRNEFAMADNGQVAAGYEPQPYNGDVLLFTAAQDQWAQPEGWERLVNGQLVTVPIDAIHTEMMGSAHIGQIAAALEPYLAGTATAPTSPAGRARS